jgi:hypothetical protein
MAYPQHMVFQEAHTQQVRLTNLSLILTHNFRNESNGVIQSLKMMVLVSQQVEYLVALEI